MLSFWVCSALSFLSLDSSYITEGIVAGSSPLQEKTRSVSIILFLDCCRRCSLDMSAGRSRDLDSRHILLHFDGISVDERIAGPSPDEFVESATATCFRLGPRGG